MKTIHILTVKNFFHDHCSYCFIYPILKNHKTFLEYGIKFKLFQRLTEDFKDCDLAIIDSRFYGNLEKNDKKKFLEKIYLFKNKFCPGEGGYPACIETYVGEQDTTECNP